MGKKYYRLYYKTQEYTVTVLAGTLKAPEQPSWRINAPIADWSSVASATQYSIKVYKNGNPVTEVLTEEAKSEYDMSAVMEQYGIGRYNFQVKAVGDQQNFTDSEYSLKSAAYSYDGNLTIDGAIDGVFGFEKGDDWKQYGFSIENPPNGLTGYTWSIEGTLPDGLSLMNADSTSPYIGGTPTTVTTKPVSLTVYVRAADESGKVYEGKTDIQIAVYEPVSRFPAAAKLLRATPCTVPMETANTKDDVSAWLNKIWLPSIAGLEKALGGDIPLSDLSVTVNNDFKAGIAGTSDTPAGTEGGLTFSVIFAGEDVVCDELTCTVKVMKYAQAAPIIMDGESARWQQGSGVNLTFRSNAPIDTFRSVFIDDKEVDHKWYSVIAGSTVVTFKPEYLETLSVGKHTLSINSTTGSATTEFTITEKATDPVKPTDPVKSTNSVKTTDSVKAIDSAKPGNANSAQTGDNSNILLWIALLFVSGGAALMLGIKGKKNKI